MPKEFWMYKTFDNAVYQVFKIDGCGTFLRIHEAAQFLMDNRKYTMPQAYEYLNGLHPL